MLNKNNFNVESDYYKEDLYIKNDYYYPLKITETDNMYLKIKLEKLKKYKDKDKVGVVEVFYNEKLVHQENVYVKVPSYPKRSIWDIIIVFKNDKYIWFLFIIIGIAWSFNGQSDKITR